MGMRGESLSVVQMDVTRASVHQFLSRKCLYKKFLGRTVFDTCVKHMVHSVNTGTLLYTFNFQKLEVTDLLQNCPQSSKAPSEPTTSHLLSFLPVKSIYIEADKAAKHWLHLSLISIVEQIYQTSALPLRKRRRKKTQLGFADRQEFGCQALLLLWSRASTFFIKNAVDTSSSPAETCRQTM